MFNVPSEHADWLDAFYSKPGNDITYSDLLNDSAPNAAAAVLEAMLDALKRDKLGTVIIVPVVKSEKVNGWYATVKSNIFETELLNSIQAWLGPTYTSVFEFVSHDVSDNRVSALRLKFNGPIIRFFGPNRGEITAKIRQYYSLIEHKPSVRMNRVRSVGEIRCDLDKAIFIGDARSCNELRNELFSIGRLNEQNKKFIDVQISAGLGDWRGIALNKPNMSTLSGLYLPPNVLSDLIEALYRVFIEDLDQDDLETVILIFKNKISSRYPGLFNSVCNTSNWRVNSALILYELTKKTPDYSFVKKLLEKVEKYQKFAWTIDLTVSKTAETSETNLTNKDKGVADSPLERNDYIDNFNLLLNEPKTVSNIINLYSCFQFIDGKSQRSEFIKYLSDIEDSQIDDLPLILQKIIREELSNVNKENSDKNGWLEWTRFALTSESNDEIINNLQENSKDWNSLEVLENEHQFSDFIKFCEKLIDKNLHIFQQSAAKICERFLENVQGFPIRQLEIAKTLLLSLSFLESKNRTDYEIFSLIFQCALNLNPTERDYLEIIELLEEQRIPTSSYNMLDWTLDICETLAVNQVPSEECSRVRQDFFYKVCYSIENFEHRITPSERLIIEFLSNDFNYSPNIKSNDHADITKIKSLSDLNGKTVAIYTLTERAGQRAQNVIEELYPGVVVKLSSEKVCSEKLKNISKTADIFLFSWRSSSHQAYYCVKDHSDKMPIYVPGKGTASIISALQNSLQ